MSRGDLVEVAPEVVFGPVAFRFDWIDSHGVLAAIAEGIRRARPAIAAHDAQAFGRVFQIEPTPVEVEGPNGYRAWTFHRPAVLYQPEITH